MAVLPERAAAEEEKGEASETGPESENNGHNDWPHKRRLGEDCVAGIALVIPARVGLAHNPLCEPAVLGAATVGSFHRVVNVGANAALAIGQCQIHCHASSIASRSVANDRLVLLLDNEAKPSNVGRSLEIRIRVEAKEQPEKKTAHKCAHQNRGKKRCLNGALAVALALTCALAGALTCTCSFSSSVAHG
eukprot:Amastigsp_a349932_63.p2 type:complete len:191 gc:universal Amastigsp_a349932_63:303-875(+)